MVDVNRLFTRTCATSGSGYTEQRGAYPMKKIMLPLIVFCLGLFVADYFFGVDVAKLARGFGSMLVEMVTSARN